MKPFSRQFLGSRLFSRSRLRWGGREWAFGSSFLLLLGTGLGLLPVSSEASTVGDEILAGSSSLRDVAVSVEEVSPSPLRSSDIAGVRTEKEKGSDEAELPYFEQAIALEKSKEWKRLLAFSHQWTRAYPKEAAAWFFLGLAYENLTNYSEAIPAYREAIRRKQDFAKAWCNLGTCYAFLGRYSEAADAFKTAVEQKEDFGRAWSDLGAAYVELGRHSEAVSALEKATRLRPDLPEAWCNLGSAYAELKKYDPAISATKRAVRLKPDYAAAWYNLAALYKETGRKEEMAGASRKVRALDPELAKELSQKLASP